MIPRATIRLARICAVCLIFPAMIATGCGRPPDEAWLRFLGFKQGSSQISMLKDNLRTATTTSVDVEFENGSLFVGQKTGTGIVVNRARVDYRMAGFSPPSGDHPLNLHIAAPTDGKATTGTLTSFPLSTVSLKDWIISTGAFEKPGVIQVTARVTFFGQTDEGTSLETEGSLGIELTNSGTTATESLPSVTVARTADASKSGATGVFTVSRSGVVAAALTVNFTTTGGNAIAGVGKDYNAITSPVVIPAGSSSVTITVTALPTATTMRTVAINLVSGSSYTLGSPSNTFLTIID